MFKGRSMSSFVVRRRLSLSFVGRLWSLSSVFAEEDIKTTNSRDFMCLLALLYHTPTRHMDIL